MNVQDIAKVCHETNSAFCHSVGDDSQLPWDQAPEWQKESAVKGVQFIIDNPSAPASATHDSWLAEKEKDGWVYGSVKDPVKKQHPCMVPYDKLPTEQQSKDHVFSAIVRSLLPHLTKPGMETVETKKPKVETGAAPVKLEYLSNEQLRAVLENHGIPIPTSLFQPKVVTSFTEDGRQIADLSQMTATKIA